MSDPKPSADLPEDRALRVVDLIPEDEPIRLRVFHRALCELSHAEVEAAKAAREQERERCRKELCGYCDSGSLPCYDENGDLRHFDVDDGTTAYCDAVDILDEEMVAAIRALPVGEEE